MRFLKHITIRRLASYLAVGCAVLVLTIWWCNKTVEDAAAGLLYDVPEQMPAVKTALLLGTSKYLGNGSVNQYFANRIAAAAALYKSGRIQKIVISGDNSRVGYDEPTDMKTALIHAGVDSNVIYLDYAGFRTYDSVYRLKEIFGQTQAVVVSQQFHNERTIYIGKQLGVQLIGFNARDVDRHYGFKTRIREYFARVKVIVDGVLKSEPHFLGEKIPL